MFPYTVYLRDTGARIEQGAGHGLFVAQTDSFGRYGEQRRTASGQQAKNQVCGVEALNHLPDTVCSVRPGCIRNRVCCLDDLDSFADEHMSIWHDYEPCQLRGPVPLDCAGHGRGRLAGADDNRLSIRRRRQLAGNQMLSLCGFDGLIEQGF